MTIRFDIFKNTMDIIVYCIAAVFVGILLWFVTKKHGKFNNN